MPPPRLRNRRPTSTGHDDSTAAEGARKPPVDEEVIESHARLWIDLPGAATWLGTRRPARFRRIRELKHPYGAVGSGTSNSRAADRTDVQAGGVGAAAVQGAATQHGHPPTTARDTACAAADEQAQRSHTFPQAIRHKITRQPTDPADTTPNCHAQQRASF